MHAGAWSEIFAPQSGHATSAMTRAYACRRFAVGMRGWCAAGGHGVNYTGLQDLTWHVIRLYYARMKPTSLTLDGVDYVVLRRADFARLDVSPLDGAPSGPSNAEIVKQAREQAGVSQVALAERLGVTQPHVSTCETGKTSIGRGYVARVLAACGLPAGWKPRRRAAKRAP